MTPEPDLTSSETAVPEASPEPMAEKTPEPSFGWNGYAERMNGRFAMVGFVALLLLELWTDQTFFAWLGLR